MMEVLAGREDVGPPGLPARPGLLLAYVEDPQMFSGAESPETIHAYRRSSIARSIAPPGA